MRRLFLLALLSGEGLKRLLAVAGRLPLCVIDRFSGFEFPLCIEASDVDFCVMQAPGSTLAARYIGRAGSCSQPDRL